MNTPRIRNVADWNRLLCMAVALVNLALQGQTVDLLQRYPTKLTKGDAAPERARDWEFTAADVFRVTGFHFAVGKDLEVKLGPADLGLGHCSDGAVWAVLIPRTNGTLTSTAASQSEPIAHLWLRFHPREISRLFPRDTVVGQGDARLVPQIETIANFKFRSSWHAGGRAMLPEPKDLTVDADTKDGLRRFFVVDTEAQTAKYVAAFEQQFVKPAPPITPEQAAAAFDKLWTAFDRDYALFALRPEIDWDKVREQYRPKALQCQSAYAFASVCAEMLRPLRDLHVWLTLAGANVPVFNRPRSANSNPSAHETILGGLHKTGRVEWAVTRDKIGFMAIYGWSGETLPAQCYQALEQMRDTRGLIVDVRLNGGGGEPLAGKVAGRFLDREFVYAYSQYRNGPNHTNLTERIARTVSPRGPWRYHRPVILLIGQKCMSSNESFIAMMSGATNVTIMGAPTCGSSGNPKLVRLPLDMTVSVPQWIDYLPDGTPLDERGFQPQVPFTPGPGAFESKHDALLTAALERLRQVPLPDKPIDGPVFSSAAAEGASDFNEIAKTEAQDPVRPKVVAVTPAEGAKGVPTHTELRVRFDRPMDPLALKLNWESGGFLDCEFTKYDPEKFEFIIPLHLTPGALQHIIINKLPFLSRASEQRKQFPHDGFQSAGRSLAALFQWEFRTQAAPAPSGDTPPKATSISPNPGSQVSLLTFVEVQFDQPMAPPVEAPPWLVAEESGPARPALIRHVQYDPARRAFRLPVLLPPEAKLKFTIRGFRGTNGLAAPPVRLEYHAGTAPFAQADQERRATGAQEPRLLQLLEGLQQKQRQMTSLSERVQQLSLLSNQGRFTELRSVGATFKWQAPDRFYGDVSDFMSMQAFRIGSDGQNWWWHFESDHKTNLVVCPARDMHTKNVGLGTPFGLDQRAPADAAASLGLNYAGLARFGDSECHLCEAWSVETIGESMAWGNLTQWWLDPQSGRVTALSLFMDSMVTRMRFLYDTLDNSSAATFAVPKREGVSPTRPEPLDQDYTTRFVNVLDGSDGRISLRWGKFGPKGTSSSGLN